MKAQFNTDMSSAQLHIPPSKSSATEIGRIAYSYARFSSAIQAQGDSLRRQYELSDNYAAKHNLHINRTLTDRGISGYRSDNLKEGALGAFIRAIHLGRVKPGSVLLVEALDRLSRDEIIEQLALFLTIISAGVEIVTLVDERSYTKESINGDPTQLIISIVYMIRGWSESQTRGGRVQAAWDSKRRSAANKRVTSKCPFWLKPSAKLGQKFDIIPERLEVVHQIFALAVQGKGSQAICKVINQQGIKPWGKGKWWNSNYVRRILRGRAVLGEYQPRTRPRKNIRVDAGDAIPDYYPAVIDLPLWHQANRNASPYIGPAKDGEVGNLFTRLVFDGVTGVSMRFHGARGTGLARLVSSAVDRGDGADGWSYDILESSLLHHLERLDWEGLFAKPADADMAAERKKVEIELDEVQLQLRRAVDFVTEHNLNSALLAQKITTLGLQEAALKKRLEEIEMAGSGQSETEVQMREAQAEFLTLVRKGDSDSRSRLRTRSGLDHCRCHY
jgi:DNA invertase Pin-like site-specific DNA recombinase